jgi:hypothetical protein
MTDTRQAWSQVADEFGGLGQKLKLHFEQAAEAHADDESVKQALDGLRDAVDRTFTAVGIAAKDSSVKEDVLGVGRSLREALAATFAEVSEDLRSHIAPKNRGQKR